MQAVSCRAAPWREAVVGWAEQHDAAVPGGIDHHIGRGAAGARGAGGALIPGDDGGVGAGGTAEGAGVGRYYDGRDGRTTMIRWLIQIRGDGCCEMVNVGLAS